MWQRNNHAVPSTVPWGTPESIVDFDFISLTVPHGARFHASLYSRHVVGYGKYTYQKENKVFSKPWRSTPPPLLTWCVLC